MLSEQAAASLAVIRDRGVTASVGWGLVLGTGLSPIGDSIEDAVAISYGDLPGFPHGAVSGHAGRLVIGTWEGITVAAMQGRAHYYEAGDPRTMAVPLETLKALGLHSVILTNSAGSLNLDWHPGTIAVLSDHIGLLGRNPLIGEKLDSRFVNMNEAYDRRLRSKLRKAATTAGVNALKEGVYLWVSGPSFETPAEVRLAKLMGADLVGMSTVPETILARHLDLRVLGVSVVTNFGTGINSGAPTHGETKDVALSASIALRRVFRSFFREEAA